MTDNEKNFDDISKPNEKKLQSRDKSGLQTAIRVVSCLPCFPKYEPRPDTPNIDQVIIYKTYFFLKKI